MSPRHIRDAVAVLKSGGVVLFPTETCYGLAADASNARAVRRVAEIKGRERGKTPPLIAATGRMAEEYALMPEPLLALARAHWPGPLTVVATVGKGLASEAVRADGTVALRVSPHPVARALSRGVGGPIVATSANVSGQPACYSARTALAQFRRAGHPLPDAILDAGPLPRKKPSTIVAMKRGKVVVLREGGVRVGK